MPVEINIKDNEAAYANAKSLSEACVALDKGTTDYVPFNGNDKLKINCFVIPKQYKSKDDIKNNSARLVYRKDIIRLVLEDDITSFGYKGFMDVMDNSGSLMPIFSQHYNLILSINISSFLGESEVKYEPYICTIKKVIPLSATTQSKEKLYRIEFRDIVSGLGDDLSFSSIYAFHENFKNSKNYEEAFMYILRHLLEYIYVLYEGEIAYKKTACFENSSDEGANTKNLFETLCTSFKHDDSYLYILQKILNVASVGVPELEKNLVSLSAQSLHYVAKEGTETKNTNAETSGNNTIPLFPLFCREEYDDVNGIYRSFFKASQDVEESQSVSKEFINRYYSFRNFAMPFIIANGLAGHSNERYLWEIINPNGGVKSVEKIKQETGFIPLMGQTMTPIKNVVHFPIDTDLIKKTWKNVHFFTQDETGLGSEILTLDWIYTYYTEALLGLDGFDPRAVVATNYVPVFLNTYRERYNTSKRATIFSSEEKKTETKEEEAAAEKRKIEEEDKTRTSQTNHCLYNSNAYICKSDDYGAERSFVIGQMMASFVLLNEAFSIDINGSITRRPNELIYFGRGKESNVTNGTDKEAMPNEANMNIPTSFMNSDHAIYYVKSVTHIFEGDDFTDRLFVNKIVEQIG